MIEKTWISSRFSLFVNQLSYTQLKRLEKCLATMLLDCLYMEMYNWMYTVLSGN